MELGSQPAKLAYTVPEVASLLSLSRAQIYRLIDLCELETVKIGRSRRITDSQVRAFLDRLEAQSRDRTSCIVDAALFSTHNLRY